jgi:probable HAF family extracellular repeat protein
MCYTQNRFKALLSACVMSLIATTGWSQSLTWLGTLGGGKSEAWGVSADGAVVVGEARNAARERRAFRWTASGGMQDLGTLGNYESEAYGVSADGAVVVGGAFNAAWQRRAFRWTAWVGCETSARWAAMRAWLGVFPPTAPWWSAGLSTPHGRGVPFAGRRRVGCETSARWAAMRAWLGAFPPTAPWWSAGLTTPQGSGVPFAGRRRVGCEDLGTLGGTWSEAYGVSADGAVVVGRARNNARAVACLSLARRQSEWKTSARWVAVRAGLMVFPPTAPWWSASSKRQ